MPHLPDKDRVSTHYAPQETGNETRTRGETVKKRTIYCVCITMVPHNVENTLGRHYEMLLEPCLLNVIREEGKTCKQDSKAKSRSLLEGAVEGNMLGADSNYRRRYRVLQFHSFERSQNSREQLPTNPRIDAHI